MTLGDLLMNAYFANDIFRLYRFKCGPYDNNAYLIVCNQTNESLLIDTPDEPEALIDFASQTNVQMIAITHNHIDHLLGFEKVIASIKAPVAIGALDAHALSQYPDILLNGNEEFKIGNVTVKSIFTPGHTEGSTCFILDDHLFTGDTLFLGGPGKSKSPEAFNELLNSISTKLLNLSGNIRFYPGHGLDGLLDDAKSEYQIFINRQHSGSLYGDIEWLTS